MSWTQPQPSPPPQPWAQPLSPPARRRRFAGWFVLIGVVAVPAVLVGGIYLGEAIGSLPGDNYAIASVLYFAGVGVLLIGGIVLACLSRLSLMWRGLGLGLVIGWCLSAAATLVFIVVFIAWITNG